MITLTEIRQYAPHDLRAWFILAASTGFVATAIAGGALATTHGRLIVAGLALCWVGDMTGPINFVGGALAFLFAHVFLIGGFISQGPIRRHVAITAGVALLVSGSSFIWIYPHIHPGHLPLILSYMLIISTMVAFAGGIITINRITLVAAIIFYASDFFLACSKYIPHTPVNELYYGPLYYTACILFAVSAWKKGPFRGVGAETDGLERGGP